MTGYEAPIHDCYTTIYTGKPKYKLAANKTRTTMNPTWGKGRVGDNRDK